MNEWTRIIVDFLATSVDEDPSFHGGTTAAISVRPENKAAEVMELLGMTGRLSIEDCHDVCRAAEETLSTVQAFLTHAGEKLGQETDHNFKSVVFHADKLAEPVAA